MIQCKELLLKIQNIPMPSRIERFGLMISLEFTRKISPRYRWLVGTKTLHNSSSSFSPYNIQLTSELLFKELVGGKKVSQRSIP